MEIDSVLGKMKNSFEKGVAAVSIKSNEIVETTKLKNTNADLEDQIMELKMQLGDSYLSHWKTRSLAAVDFSGFCRKMMEIEAEINENLKRIEEIKSAAERMEQQNAGSVMCTCGKINRIGSKFCVNCGAPLESTAFSAGVRTCSCGAVVKAEAKFCPKCGAPLTAESASSERTLRQEEQPRQDARFQQETQSQQGAGPWQEFSNAGENEAGEDVGNTAESEI